MLEPGEIEIVQHAIFIRDLPSSLQGLRVVQVSDLHIGELTDVHRAMVERVRSLNPDLVFVTGDVVDVDLAAGAAADLLRGFEPPRGTWVVPGHRDHLAGAVSLLGRALGSLGMRLLVNQSVQIDNGLWIVGIDDPSSNYDDVAAALTNVATKGSRILLAHSPHIVERVDGVRFDLALVGHTHGGQINLPPLREQWLRDDFGRRYPSGLFDTDGRTLYVNRGIGTYYLPIRIGARPEITLFTLHGA